MFNVYVVVSYVCSWSRSHTCRASFCDLAFNCFVHTPSLTLSKHRETWEGNAAFVNVFWLFETLPTPPPPPKKKKPKKQLPLKHPCIFPGVASVNGADTYHPHHCDHQGSYSWTPNVWFCNFLSIFLFNIPIEFFSNECPLTCQYRIYIFPVHWWLNINITF